MLIEDLVRPDFSLGGFGTYHKDGKPFTGIAVKYWAPGRIHEEFEMKDGEILKVTTYRSDNSGYEVMVIRNGKQHTEVFFENGQINEKETSEILRMERNEEEQRIKERMEMNEEEQRLNEEEQRLKASIAREEAIR